MFYKIGKRFDNIRILGNKFIKINRNKGKFIINNRKYSFREFISIRYYYYEYKLKIGLILNNHINNKSSMFEECESLIEFSSYKDYKELENKDYLILKGKKTNTQIKIYNTSEEINSFNDLGSLNSINNSNSDEWENSNILFVIYKL